jgi:peptidoglycan/LPS O-acetylase OafA/YrhL
MSYRFPDGLLSSLRSAWAVLTDAPLLSDVARGRNNNFNLIRFLAASAVILYHEFGVAPTRGAIEPGQWLTRGRDNTGGLAVEVFFIISGFLVTQSFAARRGSLTSFLCARALRIFPALWVAVPFSIIVASFASPVPWGAYLTHPQTIKYWWHNSLLWDLQFYLPGAFRHVPMAGDVNGSLWTLPTEFHLYLVCALLGLLGFYGSRSVFNLFCLCLVVVAFATKPEALPVVTDDNTARWAVAFLLGAAFFVNWEQIRLSIPVAVALLLSTYFVVDPGLERMYVLPVLSYATLCFSLHPSLFFRPFTRIGDYSYGLYIYAFPLQQQIVFYNPGIHWLTGLAVTYPIILGVAVLSWHFVEKPALDLKRYFQRRPGPKPALEQPELAALAGR